MPTELGRVKSALLALDEHDRLELMAFLAASTGEIDHPAPRRSIRNEYRRCYGRACSSCDKGEHHGPYRYEVWREGGAVRRRYLGKADRAGVERGG